MRQSKLEDDSKLLVIEQWEPLTITNLASDLKVELSRLDTLISPWDVSSSEEYFDLLAKVSYRLRLGSSNVILTSTSSRYPGVWHLDTMCLAIRGNRQFHVALMYMLRDSLIHYPACAVVNRASGNAYINMDVDGRIALKSQSRFLLDSALISSRTYDPFCAEIKEMESTSDSIARAYFDSLKLTVWPAK